MLITVDEIAADCHEVKFSTAYGRAEGLWSGLLPGKGTHCRVEMDLDGPLRWGDQVTVVDNERYAVEMDGNGCPVLFGRLESVDDDGFAVLRIGGAIIAFTAEGRPFEPGGFIRIMPQSLTLYDYNL